MKDIDFLVRRGHSSPIFMRFQRLLYDLILNFKSPGKKNISPGNLLKFTFPISLDTLPASYNGRGGSNFDPLLYPHPSTEKSGNSSFALPKASP